jgi:hypothetical protein
MAARVGLADAKYVCAALLLLLLLLLPPSGHCCRVRKLKAWCLVCGLALYVTERKR